EILQFTQGQVQSEESNSLVKNQRLGLRLFQFCLASCIIATIMGLGFYFLQKKTLTTQESPQKNASSAEQKAQMFYNTCMRPNTTLNESIYHIQMIIQKLGNWPVPGNWTQPEMNSILALVMSQYNTFPFFNVYVGPDRNKTQNYIQIDQPEFHFPIEWNNQTNRSKFNSQFLRPFFSSCRDLLTLLNVPFASSTQHCGLYMSLSSTLVTNTSPPSYRHSQKLMYLRMTIQELQELAPNIDWLRCLQAIFHPVPISKSDFVLVHNRPYIIYMSETISKWRQQHKMMDSYPLHTYMIMNALQTLMPALHTGFIQTMKNLFIATDNENEVAPRWKHCVLQTVKGFDTLISHLIKDHYAGEEGDKLISDIYYSFKTKIDTLNWQNGDTRDLVLNKITSLTPKLSTDNEFFNQLKPDEHFGEVIMSEKNYFSNYLQMQVLQQKMRSRLLSHTPHPPVLSIQPFIYGNDIIIPVGMFASPQFHSSYPRAVNYGMLGTIIAKDLLHLLLPDILSQSQSAVLESECVWSHYLTAQKGTSSLSPSQKQEVWVQYSALQVALLAYKKSLRRHSSDTSLSGLSHVHLFLTSFTQVSFWKLYHFQLLRRALASNKMAAHTGEKRGLEHLDEYEPKTAKQPRNMHDKMIEARLVVVLEGATLETVKVGKTFELLNCDQHKNIIIKSGRDPGNVRPDITHQSLLMLMDSPLNRAGLLQVYIHTEKNALIEINPQTRIPRTFPRFCGLMVQLLHKLSVRAADGPQRLLRMIKNPISDHLPAGCPRYAMSFKAGDAVCPRTLVPKDGPAVVVIGAFAHGAVNVDYTEKTVSISNYPLSAALTCSKICSAFEEVWGVL
ncbi:hypothetical protein QTP86_022322, partial [Hemibagrus guttatus]